MKRIGRRDLLQIGSLACFGLDLPRFLRAETPTASSLLGQTAKLRVKSCILIFCNGGPSHLDTFDMKPDAPAEIRGEFRIVGQSVLLARRLVEAGVRLVHVNVGDQQNEWYWDDHKKVFEGHKRKLAPFDCALSTLIEDLEERGLLNSTLVISLGEFGRTPKINADAGRDHWPDCYSAVLAGGGVNGGRFHGASDRSGAYPASDPVTPADLAATMFSCFGLDPATEILDRAGRGYRLADGEPIEEIFA